VGSSSSRPPASGGSRSTRLTASRAHRVARRLDAGYVSVNSMAPLPPAAPFGGWKASGHGVEGGRQGLLALMRTKNVHVAL